MTEPQTPEPFVRPDVRSFLDYVETLDGPKLIELEVDAARARHRAGRDLVEPPVGDLPLIRDAAAPGPAGDIPVRLFDARTDRLPGPVLVFFHGGGFTIGDLDGYAPLCAEIARTLDLPVVSVDYRLAPDHVYPAAPEDCEAVARWVADGAGDLGLKATSLVLAGDSAGGALTIITALALRDAPAAVPVIAQWPIYPVVGRAPDYPGSFKAFGKGYFLSSAEMKWFDDFYRPDTAHWRGSPILADQAGLPPTLVLTAGLDPLRDQGRAYAAATIAAGVPTIYREAVGTIHAFLTLRKAIPSGQGDLAQCLAVLKPMIAEAEAARVMREAAGA